MSLFESLAAQNAVLRQIQEMVQALPQQDRILWAAFGAYLIDIRTADAGIFESEQLWFDGVLSRFNKRDIKEHFSFLDGEREHMTVQVIQIQDAFYENLS